MPAWFHKALCRIYQTSHCFSPEDGLSVASPSQQEHVLSSICSKYGSESSWAVSAWRQQVMYCPFMVLTVCVLSVNDHSDSSCTVNPW